MVATEATSAASAVQVAKMSNRMEAEPTVVTNIEIIGIDNY
jgi:hypothetical protein